MARRYSSYEALAADDGADLIYVATPASHHFEHTVLFLTAGCGVVRETPFGLNEAQAAAMAAAARAEGRFLMETSPRNLPVYVRLRELMASGAIGKIVAFSSDRVPRLITAPTTLVVRGGDRYGRLDLPFDREGGRSVPGSGFHHQVRHVRRRLHDGHLDSDVMPLGESQSIMRTLDTVRAQIGAHPA
ncbi:hypothetical protein UK99_01285 [Frankia casuarinae]|nr:hypothetical protein UK99_01285 [Frankia casuarinae]